MAVGVIAGAGTAKTAKTFMARVLGSGGLPITQASLTSITYTIRDKTNSVTTASAVVLTIANVIFDSLQQADPRWTLDSASNPGDDGKYGYNFNTTIAGSSFPGRGTNETEGLPDITYRVDVTFTELSGYVFIQSWEFIARRVYG